jgi:Spy/CpxP family protein refolding chaperone
LSNPGQSGRVLETFAEAAKTHGRTQAICRGRFFQEGKKMKKGAMVLSVFLLFLIPGLSWADAAPVENGSYPPDFSQGTWGCGLNLNAEQTEKLRDLQNAFLQETRGPRDRLKGAQAELRELWNRKNPDREKIRAVQDESAALQSQINDSAERYRVEAGKVLTLGQQAQLGRFPRIYDGDVSAFGMRGELEKGRRAGTGYGSCPRL